MAKKKHRGAPIDVRKLTTWSTVGVFGLVAAIIGLTAWFVLTSVKEVSDPPQLTGSGGSEGVIESVNLKLLKTVEGRLDAKTSQTVTSSTGLRNPFLRRVRPAAPSQPTEPAPEPAPTSPSDSPAPTGGTPTTPDETPAPAEAAQPTEPAAEPPPS